MIRLRATWHIPGDGSAAAADSAYDGSHTFAARRLPGIRRHESLRALPGAAGGNPGFWRGEHLDFEDAQALAAAESAPDWAVAWGQEFAAATAGLRIDAFDIVEEYEPPGAEPPPVGGTVTALSGCWQVPARLSPADVDAVYLDVHVPGVRRLPRLRRHTVLLARNWPTGKYARCWRSAEIRFASQDDFRAVFDTAAYDALRHDGFNVSVSAHEVDVYLVDDSWTPHGNEHQRPRATSTS